MKKLVAATAAVAVLVAIPGATTATKPPQLPSVVYLPGFKNPKGGCIAFALPSNSDDYTWTVFRCPKPHAKKAPARRVPPATGNAA